MGNKTSKKCETISELDWKFPLPKQLVQYEILPFLDNQEELIKYIPCLIQTRYPLVTKGSIPKFDKLVTHIKYDYRGPTVFNPSNFLPELVTLDLSSCCMSYLDLSNTLISQI